MNHERQTQSTARNDAALQQLIERLNVVAVKKLQSAAAGQPVRGLFFERVLVGYLEELQQYRAAAQQLRRIGVELFAAEDDPWDAAIRAITSIDAGETVTFMKDTDFDRNSAALAQDVDPLA